MDWDILKNILTIVTPALVVVLVKIVLTISRHIKLLHIEILSTDHAIEKNFGNGYCKDRLTKKEELMKNYNFTHHKV